MPIDPHMMHIYDSPSYDAYICGCPIKEIFNDMYAPVLDTLPLIGFILLLKMYICGRYLAMIMITDMIAYLVIIISMIGYLAMIIGMIINLVMIKCYDWI
jgi:hypothetical protein